MALTAAQKALRQRVLRYAAKLEPGLQVGVMRAYEVIRSSMNEGEIVRLLQSGAGVERVVQSVASMPELDRMLTSSMGGRMHQATLSAASGFILDLPGKEARDAMIASGINLLNPKVLEGLKEVNSRVFKRVSQGIQDSFRQSVQRGLEAGKHSRTIAREVRDVIGLAPNQEKAVDNFEKMLRERSRGALTRELRDKRFDATLKKALGKKGTGLSEKQIQTMKNAYRRKMLSYNANTQARSAALDATRRGQRLSWEDAIDRGMIRREEAWKRRHSVGDSRVRPEHADIDGEEVPFDEPYSNGELVSGDQSYNCRCSDEYFQKSRLVAQRVDEKRTRRRLGLPSTLRPAPSSMSVKDAETRARGLAAQSIYGDDQIGLTQLGFRRKGGIPMVEEGFTAEGLSIQRVPLDKVVVSVDSQEAVSLSRTLQYVRKDVRFIAGELDDSGFLADLPVLAERIDGTYVIMEGHHRAAAAALLNEGSLRARILALPKKPTPLPLPSPTPGGAWIPKSITSPANLVREGLLAGIEDKEIYRVLTTTFPDYKAHKIAIRTYRKELIKKGLIPEDGVVIKKWIPSVEATNPAKLVREGLLSGIHDDEIYRVLRETFPDYKAHNIAIKTYRKELIKKGLLPEGGTVKPPVVGGAAPAPVVPPAPKESAKLIRMRAELETMIADYKANSAKQMSPLHPSWNAQQKLAEKIVLKSSEIETQMVVETMAGKATSPEALRALKKIEELNLGTYRFASAHELQRKITKLTNDLEYMLTHAPDSPVIKQYRDELKYLTKITWKPGQPHPLQLPKSQTTTLKTSPLSKANQMYPHLRTMMETKYEAAKVWISENVHKKWLTKRKIKIGVTKAAEDAHCKQRQAGGFSKIVMSPTDEVSVFVHEIGHAIEEDEAIMQTLIRFFRFRTQGLTPTKLPWDRGFKEIAIKDDFVDQYIGKVYTSNWWTKDDMRWIPSPGLMESIPGLEHMSPRVYATEMLSMGLQKMFEDPVRLARDDFGFFSLILEIMEGRLPTVFYGAAAP